MLSTNLQTPSFLTKLSMTEATLQRRTLELITEIDNHNHRDEVLSLMFEQMADMQSEHVYYDNATSEAL